MSASQSDRGERTATARVTVRYWAAARAAAGVTDDVVVGATVAEVLDAAAQLHRDSRRFADVLSVCSFLLGDRPLGSVDLSEVPVTDGDALEVLPPFAGG